MMIPFEYSAFYDVPRIITFEYEGKNFLLESCFDEFLDDYDPSYTVSLTPLKLSLKSPEYLSSMRSFIGKVSVDSIFFDSSRRKEIDITPVIKVWESTSGNVIK